MMNDDKLYEKIKRAAQNAESDDFPGMEKVWNRVGEKLDGQVLHKQTKLWKKFAVAASVLLVISLGFILNNRQPILEPAETQIAVSDSITTALTIDDAPIVTAEPLNPAIKEEAPAILKEQIAPQSAVVVENRIADEVNEPALVQDSDRSDDKTPAAVTHTDATMTKANFEARSVRRSIETVEFVSEQKQAKKNNPLLVVEGAAIQEGRTYDKTLKQALERAEKGDDDIVVLKEPLYIINGQYYSEEEMFGDNPTSPYAPLNNQEIETLTILQGEKAISIYGEKGRKGVVLITTKGGKPATTERR